MARFRICEILPSIAAGLVICSIACSAQRLSVAAGSSARADLITLSNGAGRAAAPAYRHGSDNADDQPGVDPFVESNTPRITADGRVMFFNSTRLGGREWAHRRANGRYDSDIYYSARVKTADGKEHWGPPVNLGAGINTADDDAVEAISPSGNTIYYSSLAPGWVRNGGPFYTADIDGAGWKNAHGLGGGVTEFFLSERTRFRIYGSAINARGDAFYFATTAHSPSGEHQIWVAYFRDGAWGAPQNLGRNINAAGGSFAPFIAADGKTLYFSSERPGGFGGDDVYMTVLRDSTWSAPENVGAGVNSALDETFFSIPAAGDMVYFTQSDRQRGTAGIVTGQLDPRFLPEGVVLLTGTVSEEEGDGSAVDALVTIENLSNGRVIQRQVGTGIGSRFAVVLEPGLDYGISVSADGYGFLSTHYEVPRRTAYKEVHKDFTLTPIRRGNRFDLNNIFFDYNSDTLRAESRPELDRLIALLRRYPSAQIAISGHTDDIGSPAYNENLSRRRAESVRRYLVERGGVDPSRLRARGYGSRNPMVPNISDEARRQNRAADFSIIRM